MTTETFISRGALFRKERLAIFKFPQDLQKSCFAPTTATSKNPHALEKKTMAAREHMQATIKFLAFFLFFHKPSIDSHTDHAPIAQFLLPNVHDVFIA